VSGGKYLRNGTWSGHKGSGRQKAFRHASPAVPVRLEAVGIRQVACNQSDGGVVIQHVLPGLHGVVGLPPVTHNSHGNGRVGGDFGRREEGAGSIDGRAHGKVICDVAAVRYAADLNLVVKVCEWQRSFCATVGVGDTLQMLPEVY
jgi:hypothetical protein